MDINLCQDSYWKIGGLIVWTLIEYWLGRTDKTKSGSILEVILNLLRNNKNETKND